MTDAVQMPIDAVRGDARTVDAVADALGQARGAGEAGMDSMAYGQICSFLPGLLEPVFEDAFSALTRSVNALHETAVELQTTADTTHATQVSALVAKWTNKIKTFVQALLNSIRQLGAMLSRLRGVLGKVDPLAAKKPGAYQFNMVENPGPLATRPGTPAANFAGGRYDEVELPADRALFRGGDSQGSPLGQWFTTEKPAGVAGVRVDTAVKSQWIDPQTGALQGSSPVDAVYEVQIPAGTKVYPGPVANQGDINLGGGHQVFVPEPWKIPGVKVIRSEPLQ
jgi:hypothetical protein